MGSTYKFNPNSLRKGIEQLLNSTRYKSTIKGDIEDSLRRSRTLSKDPNSIDVISMLGELVVSRNHLRPLRAERFREEFSRRIKPNGFKYLTTTKGRNKLLSLVRKHAFSKSDAIGKMSKILSELQSVSVREWAEKLYGLSVADEEETYLGPKGRDLFLRDMGHFDKTPIDIHEKRFIIRTGIYHLSSKDAYDPLALGDLQRALINYCDLYLRGLRIKRFDLSKNPGIVDFLIWYHCADPPLGFSVCASKPMCLQDKTKCLLSNACLFSIMRPP